MNWLRFRLRCWFYDICPKHGDDLIKQPGPAGRLVIHCPTCRAESYRRYEQLKASIKRQAERVSK